MKEPTAFVQFVARGLRLTEPGLTANRQAVAGGWRNPKDCCRSKQ